MRICRMYMIFSRDRPFQARFAWHGDAIADPVVFFRRDDGVDGNDIADPVVFFRDGVPSPVVFFRLDDGVDGNDIADPVVFFRDGVPAPAGVDFFGVDFFGVDFFRPDSVVVFTCNDGGAFFCGVDPFPFNDRDDGPVVNVRDDLGRGGNFRAGVDVVVVVDDDDDDTFRAD